MTGLYGTSEKPWVVSDYDDHAGYDCMTVGIAIGKHIVLDAAACGQGHSWDADNSDFDAARFNADAKALGQVPATLALVRDIMMISNDRGVIPQYIVAAARAIERELEKNDVKLEFLVARRAGGSSCAGQCEVDS